MELVGESGAAPSKIAGGSDGGEASALRHGGFTIGVGHPALSVHRRRCYRHWTKDRQCSLASTSVKRYRMFEQFPPLTPATIVGMARCLPRHASIAIINSLSSLIHHAGRLYSFGVSRRASAPSFSAQPNLQRSFGHQLRALDVVNIQLFLDDPQELPEPASSTERWADSLT
jgi:hypothetical protein